MRCYTNTKAFKSNTNTRLHPTFSTLFTTISPDLDFLHFFSSKVGCGELLERDPFKLIVRQHFGGTWSSEPNTRSFFFNPPTALTRCLIRTANILPAKLLHTFTSVYFSEVPLPVRQPRIPPHQCSSEQVQFVASIMLLRS